MNALDSSANASVLANAGNVLLRSPLPSRRLTYSGAHVHSTAFGTGPSLLILILHTLVTFYSLHMLLDCCCPLRISQYAASDSHATAETARLTYRQRTSLMTPHPITTLCYTAHHCASHSR